MKRYILPFIIFLFISVPCFAQWNNGGGNGTKTDSNCDQAAYYPIGVLCQDTDDGKLYKGTGAAVSELASGSSGDVAGPAASTAGEVVLFDGITGKLIKRSNTLSGFPQLTAGILSTKDAANTRTDLGLGALSTVTPGVNVATFLATPNSSNFFGMISDEGNFISTLWDDADASTARTTLGLAIGTNVQAYDADLTTYAGITPSANIQTLLGSANYSAARTNLGIDTAANLETSLSLGAYASDILGSATKYALQIVALPTDPGADRFLMWDDSETGAEVVWGSSTGLGTMTTIKEATSQVGGADIVTLDFGAGFDLTESPDTEINIALDLSEYTGAIAGSSLTLSATASPTDLFNDSDAPGTDKEIAKIVGAYIDGADGAENGTLDLYAHVAGTTTSYIQLDGKNTQVEIVPKIIASSTLDLSGTTDATIARSGAGTISVEGTNVLMSGGALGTPSSGTLTNTVFPSNTSLPGTCTVGNFYIDTDADTDGDVYFCRATNTWKAIDDDGGAGGLATTDIDTSAELVTIVTNETGSASGTPLLVFNQAPRIDNIELGAATDTTIARVGAGQISVEGVNVVTTSSADTLTNKTLDANGTGNVLKGYGYITFTKPHNRGSATGAVGTTETTQLYGVPSFADDSEANNYVDYIAEVPRDWDSAVDPVAYFKFRLGGADTADHDYIVSMIDIADSGAAAGTPADAINLAYTADGSGADGDIETATATLTGWGAAATAGSYWLIRVTRDGDDGTNDASTVDSYPMELTIRYGFTQ